MKTIQPEMRVALNVSEAAACLGVSRPTMYELLRRDDFPSFRIGNRRLISREGLAEWVKRQATIKGEL